MSCFDELPESSALPPLSFRGSATGGGGDAGAIDIGVCGGNGIGCLGALGERGRPTKPCVGDKGGDVIDVGDPGPSRGSLGVGRGWFAGRSMGRGLKGRPGLIGTAGIDRSVMFGSFCGSCGCRTPASDTG